jgi:hypothetical protein
MAERRDRIMSGHVQEVPVLNINPMTGCRDIRGFFSPSRQMLRYYFKLEDDHVLPCPLQLIIH